MYYANVSNNKFVLPGRARIKIQGLKGNQAYAEKIHQHLSNIAGVYQVTANPYTGNILIYFDDKGLDVLTLEQLIHAAKDMDYNQSHSLTTELSYALREKDEFRTGLRKVVICGSILAGIMVKQLFLGRSPLAANYGIFSVAAVTTIVTGYPLMKKGVETMKRKGLMNCDLLLSASAFTCIVLRESTLSLFIITMTYLSETIVQYFDVQSKKLLVELLRHRSGSVYRIEGDQRIRTSYEEIQPGDRIALMTGDFIPVDGNVITGSGALSHAILTGESAPHYVHMGDRVYSGTTLEDGELEIRVQNVGNTTEYRKILNLVNESWKEKLEFEDSVDQYYHKLMPFATLASLTGFIFTRNPMILLSVLLVACPKPAYGATPMALRTAMMNAYANGIFVKRAQSLEKVSKIDRVIFDKTGTLTTGKPQIKDIIRIGESTEERILTLAASCEKNNHHPVARALKMEAERRRLELLELSNGNYKIGKGVSGKVDGKELVVGNKEMMLDHHIRITDFKAKEKRLKQSGQSPLYIAYDQKIIGLIGIQDSLRRDARSSIDGIREIGIHDIEIISGDAREIVNHVALEIEADFYRGNMLPQDKIERITRLKEMGKAVAMIGDGINDCPAFSQADVSIALVDGTNHDAANCADIVVTNGALDSIPSLMDLSKYTMGNIYQSHILSIGLNGLGIILALTNVIGPFGASLYKDIHSLIILLNGMRPIKYKMNYIDR
ncbi:heavy metal translocating P-type ATPase [Anaerosolibacter carboniphilus]|uniref:Cd(2+)-exporting ATPase n=1 Tax=Anaerosolibacter carboniphilus TaxID=1417629 RepID=A0A841KVH5_9FIRM|nr:cation-translocating P-type ATPase [Anaerosolibacter carboniphilus]MBB6217654.1 heavy metal translocating P-type ATPase [Anaerosolibacter carboniphilus]